MQGSLLTTDYSCQLKVGKNEGDCDFGWGCDIQVGTRNGYRILPFLLWPTQKIIAFDQLVKEIVSLQRYPREHSTRKGEGCI